MIVEVRLYATLRRHVPDISTGVFPAEVPLGSTVIELLEIISVDPSEVHIIMVNGVNSELESFLHEGDRVGFFPAVGGG